MIQKLARSALSLLLVAIIALPMRAESAIGRQLPSVIRESPTSPFGSPLAETREPIDLRLSPSHMRYEAADAYFRRSSNPYAMDVASGWLGYVSALSIAASILHSDDPDFLPNLIQNTLLDPVGVFMMMGYVGGDRASIELLVKARLLYEAKAAPIVSKAVGTPWVREYGPRRLEGPIPSPLAPERTPNLPATVAPPPPAGALSEAARSEWNWKVREAVQQIGPTATQVRVAHMLPTIRMFSGMAGATLVSSVLTDQDLVACARGYGSRLTLAEFGRWEAACDRSYKEWFRVGKAVSIAGPLLASLPLMSLIAQTSPGPRHLWMEDQARRLAPLGQMFRDVEAMRNGAPARLAAPRVTMVRFIFGRSLLALRFALQSTFWPGVIIALSDVMRPFTEQPIAIGNFGADYSAGWKNIESRWRWHEATGWNADLPPGCGPSAERAERTNSMRTALQANAVAKEACGSSAEELDALIEQMSAKGRRYRASMLERDAEPFVSWSKYVSRFQNMYVTSFLTHHDLAKQMNLHRLAVKEDRIERIPFYLGLSAHDVGIPDPKIVRNMLGIGRPDSRTDDRASLETLEQAVRYIDSVLNHERYSVLFSPQDAVRIRPWNEAEAMAERAREGERFLSPTDALRLDAIRKGFRARLTNDPPQEALELLKKAEADGAWNMQERTALIDSVRAALVDNALANLSDILARVHRRAGFSSHPFMVLRQILGTSAPLPEGVAYLTKLNRTLEGGMESDHPASYGRVATPTIADYVLATAICGPDPQTQIEGRGNMIEVASFARPQEIPAWNLYRRVMQAWPRFNAWRDVQRGAIFRSPRLIGLNNVNLCEQEPTSRTMLAPVDPAVSGPLYRGNSRPLIDMHRSVWTVGGVQYRGFLDVYKKLYRQDLLGAPEHEGQPLLDWWMEKIDPQVARAMERMQLRYGEIVEQDVLPALLGKPRRNFTLDQNLEGLRGGVNAVARFFGASSEVWNDSRIRFTRSYSRAFGGHEVADSVIGSLREESSRWANLTLRTLMGGLPASPVSGVDSVKDVETRIQRIQEQFALAFKMFEGDQSLREAVEAYEVRAQQRSRRLLISSVRGEIAGLEARRSVPNVRPGEEQDRQEGDAFSQPEPSELQAKRRLLEDLRRLPAPDSLSEIDWYRIQGLSSRASFRVRKAYLELMNSALEQARAAVVTLLVAASAARERAEQLEEEGLDESDQAAIRARFIFARDNDGDRTKAADVRRAVNEIEQIRARGYDRLDQAGKAQVDAQTATLRRATIGAFAATNLANLATEMLTSLDVVSLVKTDILGER